MLKSHFNLVQDDEEPKAEEEHEVDATDDDEDVITDRKLNKSEISVRLSMLVQDDEEPKAEEEHEVGAADDDEDVITDRELNKSEISVRLSMLGKTAEGDGYTYLKATVRGLSLTNIDAVKHFTHLMFLDVSNNFLDIAALNAIAALPYLILIHADKNRLNSAALKQMKYLQIIIMNNNHITSVKDVFQHELSTLELGNNQIQKIDFDVFMDTLRVLDLRNNMIKEIPDLHFPILDSLYLAGNKIKSLVGIASLVNLRILHVRNNPIKILNGFDARLEKLQYVNLRNCKVSTLRQIKKLQVLKGLTTLNAKGCPYMGGTGEESKDNNEEDDAETRVEILAALPRLKKINKDIISPEEREEAKELMKQWIEDGEKEEEEEVDEEEHGEEDVVAE